MQPTDVMVGLQQGRFFIRVDGRANVMCCPAIANFLDLYLHHQLQTILLLENCRGMDSTFMGLMTRISRQTGFSPVKIINANDINKHQLLGLGLKKVFIFQEDPEIWQELKNVHWIRINPADSKLALGEEVICSVKALIAADKSNREKFGEVLEMFCEEVEKLRKEPV